MKKEKLYEAIGEIDDDLIVKASAKKRRIKVSVKRLIAAAACLCVLVPAVMFALPYLTNEKVPLVSVSSGTEEEMLAEDKSIIFGDKRYYPIENSGWYGLPHTAKDTDIGAKLGVITEYNELGGEVYEYLPAGGEAVIGIKKNNEYVLYAFSSFKIYEENGDRDMSEYLKLYGIKSAEDIEKITINGKAIAAEDIEPFYSFIVGLKDASEEYFAALYDSVSSEVPVISETFFTSGEGAMTGGFEGGSNALDGAWIIIIQGKNSLTLERHYYPNIGFISRYKTNAEFVGFLSGLIKK